MHQKVQSGAKLQTFLVFFPANLWCQHNMVLLIEGGNPQVTPSPLKRKRIKNGKTLRPTEWEGGFLFTLCSNLVGWLIWVVFMVEGQSILLGDNKQQNKIKIFFWKVSSDIEIFKKNGKEKEKPIPCVVV